jgi:hypothetical protein
MKIYLASRWSRIKEMRSYACRLRDLGHDIRSRWIWRAEPNVSNLDSPDAERVAAKDLEDVRESNCLILFAEAPRTPTRAGRMVEFGAALAAGKRIVIIGGRENIFAALPQVEHFASFHEFDRYLTDQRRLKAALQEGLRAMPKSRRKENPRNRARASALVRTYSSPGRRQSEAASLAANKK